MECCIDCIGCVFERLGVNKIRVTHKVLSSYCSNNIIVEKFSDIPLAMFMASKNQYVISAFECWIAGHEVPEHPAMSNYQDHLYIFRGLRTVNVSFETANNGEKTVGLTQFPDPFIMIAITIETDCFKRMINTSLSNIGTLQTFE
jgi:hypothetical protein